MFYRENVVKVTVEIVGPDVMRMEKDIETNFTQRLGIIGMNNFQVITELFGQLIVW